MSSTNLKASKGVPKKRAPRNRTVVVSSKEQKQLKSKLLALDQKTSVKKCPVGIAIGDCLQWADRIPPGSVDLLILDPPYNLNKSFNGLKFKKKDNETYSAYLNEIIEAFVPALKPTATIYICGDWVSSNSIFEVAKNHFVVRNRITWEREKGRGAKANWKNASEDIWFCTVSGEYVFNVDDVKSRRQVIAPYTNADGTPKDWSKSKSGNYRDTHPANLWSDITIPFWSMPENTDHPTQKSEKLLARLILASSNPGDMVLDPFLGSGTTCVVAKKLNRKALGIELDLDFALVAQKRLEQAQPDADIQGYSDGVFWARNTLAQQKNTKPAS